MTNQNLKNFLVTIHMGSKDDVVLVEEGAEVPFARELRGYMGAYQRFAPAWHAREGMELWVVPADLFGQPMNKHPESPNIPLYKFHKKGIKGRGEIELTFLEATKKIKDNILKGDK